MAPARKMGGNLIFRETTTLGSSIDDVHAK